MAGSSFTGPLRIKKSDGTKVTFVDADGNLVSGTTIVVDDGDTFTDTNGNEILEWSVVASAVNHIGISNAATGNKPIIRAEGEADNGIVFDNSEAEEILILQSAATSVNEVTITSAATGTGPTISATGGDANVALNLTGKGTGAVTTVGEAIDGTITTTSGAGAVGITGTIHEVTTTGTGDALTLADGAAGQRLRVLYVAEGAGGDTAVITPTTLAGGTTITLNNLGDTADLMFSSTGGWYVLGLGGAAAVA